MKPNRAKFEKQNIRWALVAYDFLVFFLVFLFFFIGGSRFLEVDFQSFFAPAPIMLCFLFISRLCFKIYKLIWRYGGVQVYIRLIAADTAAYVAYFIAQRIFFFVGGLAFIVYTAIFAADLLAVLVMRMEYRYIYKFATPSTLRGRCMLGVLKAFSFDAVKAANSNEANKIIVAIVGAGSAGISLAEDMLTNSSSPYVVRCFIDVDKEKTGRIIRNLPVLSQTEADLTNLKGLEIQEIIFALPGADRETLHGLYEKFTGLGYKVKTYDYPVLGNAESGKRQLREFDIEDLLFRKQIVIDDERTAAYYKDKVILITGGGGSIGSELCRQLAKLSPRQLVLVDIYENGVYDVQQELRILYGKALDLRIAIVSVTNRRGLERVFRKYKPRIVINAAAHKHVPLMEDDCIEAVENNVFGTLNTVELAEKYKAEKFIQISTDKAVNPTNVMGATKRMCEFILQAHSTGETETRFAAVRFGNVLGSAGSVVPLFKRQIANGGPLTVTDKNIIRYFMTIPEASCLVLQAGAMAGNGELFVLDMGKPVKIYDLAESMIRLSGMTPGKDIQIVETGLRPGEKLYEELLIQSEHLSKTDNELIFIEKDDPLSLADLNRKLGTLLSACESDDDTSAREALLKTVPTFKPIDNTDYAEATLDGPDTYPAS